LPTKKAPQGPERRCEIPDCSSKHLARSLCRKHYYQDRYRRGLDRREGPEIVPALLKRYDMAGEFTSEATPRRLLARIAGQLLIPECPDCGRIMVKVPNESLDLRDCGQCRVRVLLNDEEVSWLISEEHSRRQSTRIAS
jgi:hypothetical protein